MPLKNGIALQGIRLTSKLFGDTPFLERVPSTWLEGEDWNAINRRMLEPHLYCPFTVNGYWGPASDRVVLRYMPCIDPGLLPGQPCPAHAALLAPIPPPRLDVAVLPVREKARCRDCGDILPSHERRRCSRCYKVWRAGEEARLLEQSRKVWAAAVYRCLACHTQIDLPQHGPQLCPACAEKRYVEQPEDPSWGFLTRDNLGWPTSTTHRNNRGEWVIGGRVVRHKPRDESRWDTFGDTPEEDD